MRMHSGAFLSTPSGYLTGNAGLAQIGVCPANESLPVPFRSCSPNPAVKKNLVLRLCGAQILHPLSIIQLWRWWCRYHNPGYRLEHSSPFIGFPQGFSFAGLYGFSYGDFYDSGTDFILHLVFSAHLPFWVVRSPLGSTAAIMTVS